MIGLKQLNCWWIGNNFTCIGKGEEGKECDDELLICENKKYGSISNQVAKLNKDLGGVSIRLFGKGLINFSNHCNI